MAKEKTIEAVFRLTRELRESRSEVKEFREMLDRKHEEVTKLQNQVTTADNLKLGIYASFMQEHTECIARLQRLANRIHALGYTVSNIPGDPPVPGAFR